MLRAKTSLQFDRGNDIQVNDVEANSETRYPQFDKEVGQFQLSSEMPAAQWQRRCERNSGSVNESGTTNISAALILATFSQFAASWQGAHLSGRIE